jgi:hypothetical protein
VSFRRLTVGHVIALVGALALLLVMAPDWYTDKVGEQDRYFEDQILPQISNESTPSEKEKQAEAAETHEKNAWQAPAAIDRLILVLLLASAALAIAAAFLRAADRKVGPPSLSAVATLAALAAAILVAYRILQPPGLNVAAVVKWGAPAGLLCVGLIAVGSRFATLAEREPGEPDRADETTDAPVSPTPAG